MLAVRGGRVGEGGEAVPRMTRESRERQLGIEKDRN